MGFLKFGRISSPDAFHVFLVVSHHFVAVFFRRGLNRGEFFVGKLEAEPDGIPPWGTFESDRSLYEATDTDRTLPDRA